MIAAEDCVLVLLAAGRSSRFGEANKLEQDLSGRPVGLHVAKALETMPFSRRVAVIDKTTLDYAAHGFRIRRNPDAASGMAGSIRMGVAFARETQAAGVVIVLADMPRVTAAHIRRLLDAAEGADSVVVSNDGTSAMPPAVFGAGRFDTLLALEGDRGARDLVRSGRQIVAGPGELVDVDTQDALARLRMFVPSAH